MLFVQESCKKFLTYIIFYLSSWMLKCVRVSPPLSPVLAESLSWRARRKSHSKTFCSAGPSMIWWSRPVCFWLPAGGKTWWRPRRSWPPASSCASYLQVQTRKERGEYLNFTQAGSAWRKGETGKLSVLWPQQYEGQCEKVEFFGVPDQSWEHC